MFTTVSYLWPAAACGQGMRVRFEPKGELHVFILFMMNTRALNTIQRNCILNL